jgi:chromosome segregation ATPase
MKFFKKLTKSKDKNTDQDKITNVLFDSSVLRKNDITRLSIDERWTKLFVTIPMPSEIKEAEDEMNELIKQEAMLQNEQDNLEPQKRKAMAAIMNLTKEAFEEDNDEAKHKLKENKKEIERINKRINDVMEELEKLKDKLKQANIELLNKSINHIFSTLKANNKRAHEIKEELSQIEERQKLLTEERDTISLDWTNYAVQLTELIGTDPVREFENAYRLEGLRKDEAVDTPPDEGN